MITFNNIVQEIALKCVYFTIASTIVKQYESCRSISIRAEVAFLYETNRFKSVNIDRLK